MKLKTANGTELSVSDTTFGAEYNEALVHQLVTAYMAAGRAGTKRQKSRAEVRGGGRKPHSQKGTGRARAGSFQSPLWVGGGVVFGPRPQDFSIKINQKVRRLALRKALSERLKAGDVIVVNELRLESHRTRDFLKAVQPLNVLEGTLLIVADGDRNLLLGSRNVPDVKVTTGQDLNTYQVLWPDKILFTEEAFKRVEARLGGRRAEPAPEAA